MVKVLGILKNVKDQSGKIKRNLLFFTYKI
jgi:hypothetical protein